MSESPMEDDTTIFHSRLTSCASMSSSASTDSESSREYMCSASLLAVFTTGLGISVSAYYPTFELYPTQSEAPSRMSPPVGLLQPTVAHLRLVPTGAEQVIPNADPLYSPRCLNIFSSNNCTQIPKLRVACEAGPNGQRSMWAMCEQCGAINMVEL